MKATTRAILALILLAFAAPTAFAQVTVKDDITTNTTWTSDNEYYLDGLIFVNDGATLTIEPGTVIKGLEDISISAETGDGASALIIRQGGKINAVGTPQAPIVFTSELDDVNDPEDLVDLSGNPDRGLWGGVILLGRATTNQPSTESQIEGIPDTEDASYGGTDDDDSSGILRYVSIRHGGYSISGVPGDEINGLTFGGVGRGTTIDHVEVYANFDDCYEWFGGTVEARYLVGAFCADDTFDYDQGFRGKGQFWFSIQSPDLAGRAGEHDGGDSAGDDATPFSIPNISNVTYIGSGVGAIVGGDDANALTFAIRDNAGGHYWNSIFTDFPGVAMEIEDKGVGSSRERLETGDLSFMNNVFFGYGGGSTIADLVVGTFGDNIIAQDNEYSDPMIASVCRTAGYCLDPRPMLGSTVLSGAVDTGDDWIWDVSYRGAFGPDDYWIENWTALSTNGYLGRISKVAAEQLNDTVPTDYVLEQNYPNPFNPSTTIEYKLENAADVSLKVFDMLGREVRSLVSSRQTAGTYRVLFDAQGLSSGLYLYRLSAGDHVLTRNMILLK